MHRSSSRPLLVLEPNRQDTQYWYDLWAYRELFLILAWRDITVRYKQTFIGLSWAFIRPFLTMIVFTIVFGKIAQLPTEANAPYPILVFSGLLPWQFFSTGLTSSSESLIVNANLLTKVYFPRLLVPLSSIATSFVDFLVSFLILVGLMLFFDWPPSYQVLFIPIWSALGCMCTFGLGLWMSSLNVNYRDFRYVVPFLIQFGLYISPVGFTSDLIPEHWRLLYSLNPMVGVIDGFRWSILGSSANLSVTSLLTSFVISIILCFTGFRKFRSMEKSFSDVI